MSNEVMAIFCSVNAVLCFGLFAVIHYRHAKNRKSSRAKPLLEDPEVPSNAYKERLKQLDLERNLELESKNPGTSHP